MTYLLSEPRMSDREKVCAEAWVKAALDDEDPDLADYWKAEGLKARVARIAPGEEIPEPPIPEYKRRCPDCRSTTCKNYSCLL